MSLSELVGELKGQPEKKLQSPATKPELGGEVTPDGEIKLDAIDLAVVGAKLKDVRAQLTALKKEEGQLKALVLAHAEAKAGFTNNSLIIEGTQTIDLEHGPLLAALMSTKTFAQCCNMSLSQPKVRDVAAKKPQVAAAIKMLHGRKIKVTK